MPFEEYDSRERSESYITVSFLLWRRGIFLVDLSTFDLPKADRDINSTKMSASNQQLALVEELPAEGSKIMVEG